MGIRDGKTLYGHKWINAEIDDSGGERHVVPIKHTIDDYFLTEIKGQLYCFEIVPSAIKTRRGGAGRIIKYLNYDTSHFMPIDGAKTKQLELLLKENNLPRVNNRLSKVFKMVGNMESQKKGEGKIYGSSGQVSMLEQKPEEPTRTNIEELLMELDKLKEYDEKKIADMMTFIKGLGLRELVTPILPISNFIEDDLKATRPAFLGSIVSRFQSLDETHKRVTNTPISSKHDWARLVAVLAMVGLIATVGYIGYTQGWFDFIVNMIPNSSGQGGIPGFGVPAAGNDFFKKYPTPEAAKAAIDRGEITINQVPANMRDAVQKVKTPTATPKG